MVQVFRQQLLANQIDIYNRIFLYYKFLILINLGINFYNLLKFLNNKLILNQRNYRADHHHIQINKIHY